MTNEKISLAVAGTDGEDEMEELLTEDGAFMQLVIDHRDHLVTLQKSLLDEKTPSENASPITITDENIHSDGTTAGTDATVVDRLPNDDDSTTTKAAEFQFDHKATSTRHSFIYWG